MDSRVQVPANMRTAKTRTGSTPVIFMAKPRDPVTGPDRRARVIRGGVAVVSGGIAVMLTHALATQTGAYSFASAATQSIRSITPAGLVVACATAYGAVLVVVALDLYRGGAMLLREPHLCALLLGTAAASLLGGTNTELFLLWGPPRSTRLVAMSSSPRGEP